MKKIVELGACSMLDHEFPEDFYWIKRVHKNEPKYMSRDIIENRDLTDADVVIYSSSIRDSIEYDINKSFIELDVMSKIIDLNITQFSIDLLGTLNLNKSCVHILLGSISANEMMYYKSRPFYASSKAYQRTLFKNLSKNYTDHKFIEISCPSVKTRMCNHGLDSELVFNKVCDLINTDFDLLPSYQLIQIHERTEL